VARKAYQDKRKAAVRLQAAVRQHAAAQRFAALKLAACSVQVSSAPVWHKEITVVVVFM
jgi:hypothetical protein